jgi:hypothetical protein
MRRRGDMLLSPWHHIELTSFSCRFDSLKIGAYGFPLLRTLAKIEADIRALEWETDGLLDEILMEVH